MRQSAATVRAADSAEFHRPSTFAALAFELRLVARAEHSGNQDVEHYLARHPDENLQRVLDDLRRTAELIGEASVLLSKLSPFEHEVRAILDRETASAKRGTQ